MKTLAILGLGKQGRCHLLAAYRLIKLGILDRIIICDTCDERLEEFKHDPRIQTYNSLDTLLRECDVNLFTIALPNSYHYAVTRRLLEKGKKILKEKPFALTLEEGNELHRIANSNMAYLEVAQQRTYHPGFINLSKHIAGIGSIRYCEYSLTLDDNSRSWYWSRKLGGGAWLGLGWHVCDMLIRLLGNPVGVSIKYLCGKDKPWMYDTEDSIVGDILYEGFTVRIYTSVVSPRKKEDIMIEGKSGTIYFNRKELVISDASGNSSRHYYEHFDWIDAYELQLKIFIEKANKGVYGLDHNSISTMKLIEAGRISADRSQIVALATNHENKLCELYEFTTI